GTWDKPLLNGAVAIRNGAITYPGIDARHQGIDGRLVMHGDTLQVERLSMMSGGGTLNVRGTIRMDELTRPIMNLHLTARDFFSLNVRDFVTATATGEFDLLGP